MSFKKDLISLSPFTISLIYLVVASLWILLTDRLVEFLLKDPDKITIIQTYKGWFYVTVTSLGLFYLISKYDEIKNMLTKKQKKDLELRTKLLEKIPVMITMYDPKLEKMEVNQEYTKVTGYSNVSTNTLDLMEACFPNEEYRKEVLEFMNQPEKGWKELVLTTKSGDQIYNSWTNIRLTDETQVGIGVDLTEIRESENELKERNKFIESIIDNIPIGIAVNEIDTGEAILINDQFSDIYGWPKNIITDVEDFFNHVYKDADFREKIKKQTLEDIMSGNPEKMHWEKIPIDRKDGTKKYINAKNIAVSEQNLMISTVLDVTNSVLAEKELKDSEERYRHIFQNNPQPMWIYDLNTLGFLEVNKAAIEVYGYSKEEFLSMKISDIRPVYEHENLKNAIKNIGKENDNEREWIHQLKNGEERIVNIYSMGIIYENKQASLILVNDITEKKKNKELLIQSAFEGEDKERKRIAQELHDGIGQYLSAVNLNMESIKKEIPNLTDKKQVRFLNTLSIIKKAIKETRALAYTLMPVELDEYGLLLAIKSLSREIEGSFGVKIKNAISEIEDILDMNMKSNFYRIIQEAFNNAIKHGEADFIELTLKHENEFIYCRIKDNGKGMNTNKLNEATGLGIKSIKARTETMSGELNIKSKPGEGLEITIKVPVKQTSRI
tara:strand:- start:6833 stop:8836 length:2004 start_codon:yes stop_codon:yes gene_type:complete